jgi:hypothetical protein
VTRYKVQFTASAGLKAKLDRARELLRHRNPSGDLEAIMERAVDLLVAQLEKERLAKTARPKKAPQDSAPAKAPAKAPASTTSGYVSRAVRREVFARDGERCTFVDDANHRCEARGFLEIDHVHPRALGGSGALENLRVRCRQHNGLAAERHFGRPYVEAKKSYRRQRGCVRAADPRAEEPSART